MKQHTEEQLNPCDVCGKYFYMKWRLNKHKQLHDNKPKTKCHYFNNGKVCPFDEVGCKFLHEISDECRQNAKCTRKLCPFQHLDKNCTVCKSDFKAERGRTLFNCEECDKDVCPDCAKETHISKEHFTCSPCLL